MQQVFSFRDRFRQFLIIFAPIFVTQVALSSLTFCDTVMSGRISAEELAGVSVGSNLYFPVYLTCLAILSGLTPIIVFDYGAKHFETIPEQIRQGFFQALFVACFVFVLAILFIPIILEKLPLTPYVEHVAFYYLVAVMIGLPIIFFAMVLQNFINALGYTRWTMAVTLITVPLNIFFNYLFMFGYENFIPAFGGIGAGIGTSLTQCFNLLFNFLIVIRKEPFKNFHIFEKFSSPNKKILRHQFMIGLPIGGSTFCEVSMFSVVGLLVTQYGTQVLAAHQATHSFIALCYMLPYSVSLALTILVGFEWGAERLSDAKKYAQLGRIFSFSCVVCLAILFFNLHEEIAHIYTKEAGTFELILQFLLYGFVMQLVDCLNAPLQGVLRGAKDVRATFLYAVFTNWVVGVPLGIILSCVTSLGAFSYWIGIITGLVVNAICLEFRLKKILC